MKKVLLFALLALLGASSVTVQARRWHGGYHRGYRRGGSGFGTGLGIGLLSTLPLAIGAAAASRGDGSSDSLRQIVSDQNRQISEQNRQIQQLIDQNRDLADQIRGMAR